MNWQILRYDQVSSTQDTARKLIAAGADEGTIIVADEQERGRGRRGRAWISPCGGFYASLVLRIDSLGSLRVGIAVAEALRDVEIKAMLKWPNDVLVGEKKIAGVLVENVGDLAIVGVGVNLVAAPVATATCVTRETTILLTQDDLLKRILQHLAPASPKEILKRYRALSATIGRDVRVEVGTSTASRPIVGRAAGIDSLGRLLIEVDNTLHTIASGSCIHLRFVPRAGWRGAS
jgi:BirA family biotin operon repressor/biotin-[acetyl-CoA-carboxylase] ligase